MVCNIENQKGTQAQLPVCVSKIAVIDTIVVTLWHHVHLHLDEPRTLDTALNNDNEWVSQLRGTPDQFQSNRPKK